MGVTQMKTKTYLMVSAAVFTLVAILHAAWLALQAPMQFGSAQIPMWIAWLGLFGAGFLALWGFAVSLHYRRY